MFKNKSGETYYMEYSKDMLRYEEQIIMQLRKLYSEHGYSQYRMSRFEEYELYAANKAFLPPGEILTFSGSGGKLLALRPDVTLSIVKNVKDDGELKKLYYNENVYRTDGTDIKEQMQVGLECIGDIDTGQTGEVIRLALKSLEIVSGDVRLDISHMGFLGGLIKTANMTVIQEKKLIDCISEKNTSGLKTLCDEYELDKEFSDRITKLSVLYGSYDDVIKKLREISVNDETDAALRELEELNKSLNLKKPKKAVFIDFSVVNDISYYSGVIFQGYIKGIPARVLSGGRYDELLRKFGKKSGAIGFAVYLDKLDKPDTTDEGVEAEKEPEMLNIALPKGRLGEKAFKILETSGYGCHELNEESRKLVFENRKNKVRYFWVKPSDVTRYVERGVADIGIAGKDILLEYSPDVYELLDLGIGKCRICVAAEMGFTQGGNEKILRVATKFPKIARDFYRKQGRDIDVIELNGSVELAPLLGLSDVIVDIVETGQTLSENKLEPVESITDISARLISNKTSYKFKHGMINKLCKAVSKETEEHFNR